MAAHISKNLYRFLYCLDKNGYIERLYYNDGDVDISTDLDEQTALDILFGRVPLRFRGVDVKAAGEELKNLMGETPQKINNIGWKNTWRF